MAFSRVTRAFPRLQSASKSSGAPTLAIARLTAEERGFSGECSGEAKAHYKSVKWQGTDFDKQCWWRPLGQRVAGFGPHRSTRAMLERVLRWLGSRRQRTDLGRSSEAGDHLLVFVAERLLQSVRPTDVVARLGGDEFVVLLSGMNRGDALAVAERMVASLDRKDEHALVTASVGVAPATPSGSEREAGRRMLREADAALLEAKRFGKCRALHHDDIVHGATITR
jgi:hypothetical protein